MLHVLGVVRKDWLIRDRLAGRSWDWLSRHCHFSCQSMRGLDNEATVLKAKEHNLHVASSQVEPFEVEVVQVCLGNRVLSQRVRNGLVGSSLRMHLPQIAL